ncbi:hypothetical protein, conserved [Trypanosoma brucei gambiense DAL972]|uniref:BTB domain-containing protein n=3 Tax=Trypanosoma brucei TaxID=5691 RepID=Q384L1_TRYB2|nr:hypothetical protein, conserved [Trypanosoma brucei gambiense DAL972]XP_828882.1 hypothetical protein, conserved [Trypanosoma brucei brucei TREU927]EAN79770.1 hypothetical protein, conserved [Trypanosoma brucei brucei TREU927]RHW67932.1 btb/poz domain containing protein [Trypanosoma brucei equiperdum]CBH17804.1 hypothetical protein, conserved [Trypanosoma brucei gambiense DAL972]|eukprot:XP_011780068.1 hypothetical protein, conserved [Trypanosoma brucei gambiense DAL972]
MRERKPIRKMKRSRVSDQIIRVEEPDAEEGEASPAKATPVPHFSDRRICINVGGEYITTLASTLCSEPSKFSEWVENNFQGLPRDSMGNPFIDRDPENFRQIISYLRGYELPTATEKIVFLAEDAEYYHIDRLLALINPPAEWRFVSGPGVSSSRKEFSTENILATCGNEPLPQVGKSVFLLRIDKCELVSIGLVGTESPDHDEPLERQTNAIAYRSTGELIRSLNSSSTFFSGNGYKGRDTVMVQVLFKPEGAAQIEFFCNDVKTHETEWLSPVPPLRFAVSLHGVSAVVIERCVAGVKDEDM